MKLSWECNNVHTACTWIELKDVISFESILSVSELIGACEQLGFQGERNNHIFAAVVLALY